jgi:peptidoglycan/LPS O-acetylase OafA/YrhL
MKEIRQLTGLRGVVALDVVLGHYDFGQLPLAHFLIFHNAAVDIFFCLSSFTLSLVYRAGSPTKLDLWRFASARFARIYPAYFVTLMGSVAILAAFAPQVFGPTEIYRTTELFVWQLLVLSALPIKSLSGAWDIPAWSVSVEIFCYALLFPTFHRISRFAGRTLVSLPALIVICVSIDFYFATYHLDARVFGIGYGRASDPLAYWTALVRGFAMFTAGWLMFLLWSLRPAFAAIVGRLTDAVAIAFVVTVVSASMGFGSRQIVVFLAPLLIAGLMDGRSVTAVLLASPPIAYLGRISYSLYLIHVPVLIAYHCRPVLGGSAAGFYAPLSASFVLAIASYHFIEKPSRRFLRQGLAKWPLFQSASSP